MEHRISTKVRQATYDLLKEVRALRKDKGQDFRDKVVIDRAINQYCKKELNRSRKDEGISNNTNNA